MITFHDLSLDIQADYNGILTTRVFHVWEQDEVALHARYVRSGDIILHAGLGSGWLAVYCAFLCGDAERVICYEPNPMLCKMGRFHKFNGKPLVIHHAALVAGTLPGNTIPFPMMDNYFTASSKQADGQQVIDIPAKDINEALTETGANVLSLDVEGDEEQLLPYINYSALQVIIVEIHSRSILDVARSTWAREGFELVSILSKTYNGQQLFAIAASHWLNPERTVKAILTSP